MASPPDSLRRPMFTAAIKISAAQAACKYFANGRQLTSLRLSPTLRYRRAKTRFCNRQNSAARDTEPALRPPPRCTILRWIICRRPPRRPTRPKAPVHHSSLEARGDSNPTAPLATSYDEIPYPRLAFPYTHPSHLATIGRLLGLLPAPVDRCRVLELGCASGANLIPMAFAVPGSTFVGIDLSERQIAEGRGLVDALGLPNVVLEHIDICAVAERLADQFGPFDYIIAHGIYSWVPDAVKESLLAACRRLLAPEGIAYVSYNCYPACQLREMIRRMCQYHGRQHSDPRAFLAANRLFLEFILDALPATDDPYRMALRDQAQGLLAERDAVILHDDLERDNDPQLLHQFLADATCHGLQYLGDTHFGQMFGIGIETDGLDLIRQGGDVTDFQQYLDFLYGRALRTTLLCREEVTVRHHLVPEAVRDLWISSSAEPLAGDNTNLTREQIGRIDLSDPAPLVFRCDECTTAVASNVGKAAMLEISAAFPKPLAFDALIQRVKERLPTSNASELAAQLAPIALEWFAMRLVELRAFEPPISAEPSARPIASALARYQVVQGWGNDMPPLAPERTPQENVQSPSPRIERDIRRSADAQVYQVTNLVHRRITLGGDLAAQVLLQLDGRHDRAQIVETLAEPVLNGEAEIRVDGRRISGAAAVRELLAQRVEACLNDFARNSLLMREVVPG